MYLCDDFLSNGLYVTKPTGEVHVGLHNSFKYSDTSETKNIYSSNSLTRLKNWLISLNPNDSESF